MLDLYDNYFEENRKQKLLLTLNGDLNSAIITMEYSLISMKDIKKKAEHFYSIELDRLRLFTQQGVEIFEEDLMFLKDGTLLYVSDSRDFDAYSQFSVYQIIKTLGEGGFGKVMLGKHKLTQEQVAIKIIDSGKLWNAADIDLVFREAEVMKNLRHKNIIKIINCYTLPSMQVILIMEFLEGGDLVDYIQQKGKLSEEEARIIFRQIADAICYCHDQKLVHRDLKLENILLTSKTEKQVKIIDFGIATVATNFIIDKIDLGSLSYMPPEVLSGQIQQIRPSIDIWAMGVILFALVCGTLPFTRPLQEQTVQNILKLNYQFPNISLSKEYKELVQLMLNPDPNERYSAYQVLGHPWLRKSQSTLQAPSKLFPKGIIKRDYTKISGGNNGNSKKLMTSSMTIGRDFTCLQQGKTYQSNGLESPTLIIRSPSQIKPFESLKQQTEILESQEPEQQQDEKKIIKTVRERKLSSFNQKLIDKIFKEDRVVKRNAHTHPLNSPKESKERSPIERAQIQLSSAKIHSKQSSEDFTKRVRSKQIKLRTIINLSQLTDLKMLYGDALKKNNEPKRIITEQNDSLNLYKLQLSFRHRKMRSDQLLQKTFKSGELKISELYSTLFK
ncbi:unnamed protein product [Paramecium primaurelia]|uniref:Protein kinase domain-containing protein n=1 Tax=Paramecium primaurelia TaxID=5886 RepID=A0A8S1PSS5_PARPR|nr:unnamed protein product [Paramecium primaurelia]